MEQDLPKEVDEQEDIFDIPPSQMLETTAAQLEFMGRLARKMGLLKANKVIQEQITIELRAEEIYQARYGGHND